MPATRPIQVESGLGQKSLARRAVLPERRIESSAALPEPAAVVVV
jgi:hypothetical protein